MKLNVKRTLLVGFAFMSIFTFWEIYNSVIPLILKTTFDLNEVVAGIVMGADNLLGLFMLPLFGALSDRTNTKMGKRIPYVLFGTIFAVVSMIALMFFNTPTTLMQFIIFLGILLIAMGTYRSPAVALMPDVTPKPLFSKANAVINLMGTGGGLIGLALIGYLSPKGDSINYFPLFISTAIIMLLGSLVVVLFAKENKYREEKLKIEESFDEGKDAEEVDSQLNPHTKKSLMFMLLSIFLWYFGYNAVISAFSKYAVFEWGLDGGTYSKVLVVAMVSALLFFIPIGLIATKIGRKKTIFIGIIILTIAFSVVVFLKEYNPIVMIVFAFAGIGWSAIIVNSYPMVVALGSRNQVGVYTGYYYTASMSSQIVTPILSGLLLEYMGYWTLFPYGALFVALSGITLFFVNHGDHTPDKHENALNAFDVEG